MHFLVSVLWIAIGTALLGFARSYWRTGNRITAAIVGALGMAATLTGIIF